MVSNMTNREARVFRNPFSDSWYFWDDAWAATHGPYEDYNEAHAAMSALLEAERDKKENDTGGFQAPC